MIKDEKNGTGPGPEEITPEIPGGELPLEDEILEELAEAELTDGGGEDPAAVIEGLREENKELMAALARARADFVNYRKRVERDRARERAMAGEEKAMDFLPVLDNLDRALSVDESAGAKSILMGVTMVRRQFMSVLESMGVEQIPTVGAEFSPLWHEAVAAEPTDDPEMNGRVTEEILSGFRTAERALRPAKVKVASFTGETEE
ncbi:MAG: nucleotide exchange factor GrpE [Aminivibrio sp.]|jgi:molecular chaperone GrpE|nr:nucleotide exchange factor GrpE [Synergistaceae bacterium]